MTIFADGILVIIVVWSLVVVFEFGWHANRAISCPFFELSSHWELLWAFALNMLLARLLLENVLALPTDWDSLAYHLPLVDHWLREEALYVPDCAFWYVPGNFELLTLWLVAPFSLQAASSHVQGTIRLLNSVYVYSRRCWPGVISARTTASSRK